MLRHSFRINNENWPSVRMDLRHLVEGVQLEGTWQYKEQVVDMDLRLLSHLENYWQADQPFNGIMSYTGLTEIPCISQILINGERDNLDRLAGRVIQWANDGYVCRNSIVLTQRKDNKYRLTFRIYNMVTQEVQARLKGHGYSIKRDEINETYLDNPEMVEELQGYLAGLKTRLNPGFSIRFLINGVAHWVHYNSRDSDIEGLLEYIQVGNRFAYIDLIYQRGRLS